MKKPYKQGLLDGMCGFYSVINAIHFLKPGINTVKAEKLLKNMIKIKPYSFHNLYCDGTYYENVVHLVKHTLNNIHGYKDLSYSTPFEDDTFDDAYEYTSCLKEFVDGKNSVAIVSVGHPWYHWTVISKVDTKEENIQLFDSYFNLEDKGSKLSIKDLSLKKKEKKFELYTYETIIITKN